MLKYGNKILLSSLVCMIQFFSQNYAYAQEDCRDINGDLIEDCTCTNISGIPISCTDGTVLPTPVPTPIPTILPTPIPTQSTNPGNDGIDNDGDGEIDEADENLNFNLGRSPRGATRPKSVPARLDLFLNPNDTTFNHFNNRAPGFEIICHYIHTYPSDLKPEDVINLRIRRKRDNFLLEKDIHYTRTFNISGNMIRIPVTFLPDAFTGYEEYDISVSINNKFKETQVLTLSKEKIKHKFGPTKRITTYGRVIE